MRQKLFVLPILLLFVQIVFSQTIAEKDNKNEISVELKKEATVFLRETAAEVNGLRTLENRISFSSEMASLMWFSDEKEARAMFQNVINDFRQLLITYNSQINENDAAGAADYDNYSFMSGSANQPERKFAQAIGVRQQIAKAIAEHDPQLAFEFFSDTGAAITNAKFRRQIESSDSYFEARLLNQIADKNIEVAIKYGRKTLAKGLNYETLSLLKKVYAKDPEKGAAFGEEIVSKLKSDVSKPDGFYYLTNVLDLGLNNRDQMKNKKPEPPPMFSEQTLRDLAELTAQEILKREDAENSEISSYLADIEKVLPARAAQIRQKFEIKQKVKVVGNSIGKPPPPPPAPPMPSGAQNSQEKLNRLSENIKSLDAQKLSDEDRKKVVAESRKIIAESPSRQQRMLGLTALAVQVAKLGDKELAADLMNEVRGSVNIQPRSYRDFMEIWMLAGSYAQVDPSKAFPLLEDSILRLNDTISAFIKVGEFVDVSGEIINDGEVQVGGFGGEIMSGLLRELGATDTTIRNLAIADFARTKSLTEKFDRTEVRILAKMLVLRGVFANSQKPKTENVD